MRSVFAQTIIWRGRSGVCRKSELVWSNQGFDHPSLNPICLFFNVLDRRCCATCWGRDLQIDLQSMTLKDLPHTYSCTCFYSKEKQYKQGLCRFWITGESNFYWGKGHEMLKCISIFFIFSFYYDQLGMMGNFAGWRNEHKCTSYVGYLPDGTYQ